MYIEFRFISIRLGACLHVINFDRLNVALTIIFTFSTHMYVYMFPYTHISICVNDSYFLQSSSFFLSMRK